MYSKVDIAFFKSLCTTREAKPGSHYQLAPSILDHVKQRYTCSKFRRAAAPVRW